MAEEEATTTQEGKDDHIASSRYTMCSAGSGSTREPKCIVHETTQRLTSHIIIYLKVKRCFFHFPFQNFDGSVLKERQVHLLKYKKKTFDPSLYHVKAETLPSRRICRKDVLEFELHTAPNFGKFRNRV